MTASCCSARSMLKLLAPISTMSPTAILGKNMVNEAGVLVGVDTTIGVPVGVLVTVGVTVLVDVATSVGVSVGV